MRSVTVLAVLMLCLAGIATATTPPAQCAPTPGYKTPSAGYHPRVSPDIAALQAQERAALANGDVAAAREIEKQVQAMLIEQQQVVPHSCAPMSARPPLGLGASLEPDNQIFTGSVYALSADYEMDGTMWAAFGSRIDSTVWIYKSTDHGVTWPAVRQVWWEPKALIRKIVLVVGEGDSGFVYLFQIPASTQGDLYVARFSKDGSGLNGWAILLGDTLTDFTACRDFSGDNYWLYAVGHSGFQSGDYRRSLLLRSTDYARTWAVTDTIYNAERPCMAFGAGSYGYLSGVPGPSVWKGWVVAGVTTLWSSPGTWHFNSFKPDTLLIDEAAIAPAFTTPPESAITWVAYSQYHASTVWDVYSFYAVGDTLLLWNGPYAIANSSFQEGNLDLKNYTSSGNPYVNVSYVRPDTGSFNGAWLGYSNSSSPTVWTSLGNPWVNQSVSCGMGAYVPPRIVYSPGGPGPGGGLIFSGSSDTVPYTENGYFNAPWFTGMVENRAQPERPAAAFSVAPSVARGPVRVSWHGSATRLVMTDVAGRIVRSVASPPGNSFIWDGKTPAGIYLVCLTTRSGTATKPVVIQ